MEQELERLEGTVEDIIYLNEDNGYTVFEVSGGGVVTVVCGVVGELHAGESVVCRGRYENHATYGRQFHAQECEDIDKNRAEAARIRAEERLQHKQSMHEYYQTKIALDRAVQRLQTAAKYKR